MEMIGLLEVGLFFLVLIIVCLKYFFYFSFLEMKLN